MEKKLEENAVRKQYENEKKSLDKHNYVINPKNLVGKGSFGRIYSGTNKTTGEEVAIKLEPIDTDQPQLIYEYKIYKLLEGGYGFPRVYDFSRESKSS